MKNKHNVSRKKRLHFRQSMHLKHSAFEKQFTKQELNIFRKYKTPAEIQDYLNTIPINYELDGETCLSPRIVLKQNRAHCLEGALLAAAMLRFHNHKPLVMMLETVPQDECHVVALFKQNECWGAISKTNHAVLRYRDPIFKSVRELAFSYFNEYFLSKNGKKTLRYYTVPMNLSKFDKKGWMTSEKDVWFIDHYLDTVKNFPFASRSQIKNFRKADPIEIKASDIVEWKKPKGAGKKKSKLHRHHDM